MQSDTSDGSDNGTHDKTRNNKRRKRNRSVSPDDTIFSPEHGKRFRPLTRHEVSTFVNDAENRTSLSAVQLIALRKLKLQRERQRVGLPPKSIKSSYDGPVSPLSPTPPTPVVNSQVIDALYSIKSTPFERSFLSRLCGMAPSHPRGVIAVDWETTAPWMHLLNDIRDHYGLAHPDREQSNETTAPITYVSLQSHHLDQVHDLLTRVFWSGIDVSDSLQYSPERCTVVATYKKLVVGVAILSSPQETYITYLAVKPGWDNAQIATAMLYHLIVLNPNKDITLHVSANSPAMLLYNRFGFKAEEFVAGFYEDYLDPESRASKNAFRLRLRR